MAIAQQTIALSGSTIFTSTNTSAITAVFLMNDHSGTVTLQVHIVSDGDSRGTSNKIFKDLTIAAGDTFIIDTERLILDNNDTVQVTADVDAVVHATVSHIGV